MFETTTYSTIYRGLFIPGGCLGSLPSSIQKGNIPAKESPNHQWQLRSGPADSWGTHTQTQMVHHIIIRFVDLTRGPSIQTPERTELRYDWITSQHTVFNGGQEVFGGQGWNWCFETKEHTKQPASSSHDPDWFPKWRSRLKSHEKVTYRSKQGHSEERGISCGIYSFHICC